ncbi:unnamed protein product [Blepharisma stoltei]|uniref:Uncharacterized protein n=1 Tax=Blepharisma stoltei TaxID=1481888 RepID=A0AAU9J7G2_9CILI|nr:unnamed protein product [Blepharisma stoltei]
MSRDTIFTTEPAKYFQSEDLPQKPKHATHLVTYPNFLISDIDHSLDRPFTSSPQKQNKKFVYSYNFNINRENLPQDFDKKPIGKKRTQFSNNAYSSTFNPISFDASQSESKSKPLKKRNPFHQSSLKNLHEDHKLSVKSNYSKIHDSRGVKDLLNYS